VVWFDSGSPSLWLIACIKYDDRWCVITVVGRSRRDGIVMRLGTIIIKPFNWMIFSLAASNLKL
jgi:hypothetical protein